MEDVKTIHELVREAENNDKNGITTSSKYVQFSMRDDIEKTEAYINSKHISGDVDYMGREKPFFNIVVAARNIWFRATDIDRKNIVIRANSSKTVIPAFLATILLQEWMKKVGFGKFLNDWGLTLATHGSAITKFVEKDGELHCQVMDWNTMIVDAVDFDNNLKIEKLWLTPAQLRSNESYDQQMVESLIETTTTRKTIDGTQKDNKSGYIPIYEVHGKLPLSLLTGKEKDDTTYVQQIHIVSFLAKKEDADEYDEYALYQGREARDPYMITHLLKKDGQTYSGGAVKNLFEAQWMVNHSQKQIKDQLDLASKIIFQTSDDSFVGQNALTSIENGEILKHKVNEPITRLAGTPDIAAIQSFQASWQAIAAQINGISEAMLGQNPPSGSAWRQTQALLQESHSLFETMTETKGLALIDMMTNFVIPFFKKTLNNAEEVAAILDAHQIKELDAKYLPNEVTRRLNAKKKRTILSGAIYNPDEEATDAREIEAQLKGKLEGNQRFLKPDEVDGTTWKELFKDLEWTLDIDVTGEARDVQGALATLTTVLQTLAGNPGVLQDPNIKLVFSKILNLAGGFSPLELTESQAPQPQMPPQLTPQPT